MASQAQIPFGPSSQLERDVKRRLLDFLLNYAAPVPQTPITPSSPATPGDLEKLYVAQAGSMAHGDRTTMVIDFGHLLEFDGELAEIIMTEYYRLDPILRQCVQSLIGDLYPDHLRSTRGVKEFFVSIRGLPVIEKVRALRTSQIGSLQAVSGTVTRTSEVRPELMLGVFHCIDCSTVVENVEQQFKYTEPTICPNAACQNRTRWKLNIQKSKFVDWQKIKVQENSDEIPPGSMPRSMDVILRHEVVDEAKPGDKVVITGTLIAVPDVGQMNKLGQGVQKVKKLDKSDAGLVEGFSGLKDLGVRELTYRLCFLACSVEPIDDRMGDLGNLFGEDDEEGIDRHFSTEDKEAIFEMKQTPNLYQRLVDSVAPGIYGHKDIKAGVLLMLFGGVHKKTQESIQLRGDINVCIVGDPSCAKSQFLKYVCSFVPRSVYTSGKAASAAGLTASVVKDPESGEFCIEAGALLLADNGVCCIDEFDKMDPKDQVAIHEAMEQQTISITKAGIQATLKARTSILAAANPVNGRYDRSKTLRQNVHISAPIMSRFDLFFVLLDECNEDVDNQIAQHIVSLHRAADLGFEPPFSSADLQRYIAFARSVQPVIIPESQALLVECYRKLRQNDIVGHGKSSYRITVRQLESLVRLSEALARLHLDDEVKPRYVRESFRLLKQSIIHVETDGVMLDDQDYVLDENNENAAPRNEERDNHAPEKSRKIQITFEKYQRIAHLLCHYLRQREEGDLLGTRLCDVVTWYLSDVVKDEIQTEEQLLAENRIVRHVIKRLVEKDHVLVYLDPDTQDSEPSQSDNRLIAVHPNFVLEGTHSL